MSQRPIVHVPRYILEATSLLWVQKQLTCFYMTDSNHDGVISPDEARQKRCTLEDVAVSGEVVEATGQAVTNLLDHVLVGCVTLNAEGNNQVLWKDYIIRQYQRIFLENGLKKERETWTQIGGIFFDIMDTNCDGVVDRDEVEVIFRQAGLSKHDTMIAFTAMDANSDGKISRQEYLDAVASCMFDTHFTPGALACGFLASEKIVPTED